VLKIITFTKNGKCKSSVLFFWKVGFFVIDKFQALIQSKDPNGAAQAKLVNFFFYKD
jgi:hypothetical protein